MLVKNIERIMTGARFEHIEDARPVFGSILGFGGVWATGREVVEEWLQIKARRVL